MCNTPRGGGFQEISALYPLHVLPDFDSVAYFLKNIRERRDNQKTHITQMTQNFTKLKYHSVRLTTKGPFDFPAKKG